MIRPDDVFANCRTLVLSLGVCGCLLANSVYGQGFLVKDGQPQADIVIAEAPPRAVKLAAEELQTYIQKISGAKLPVVTKPGADVSAHVYVGGSAHTDQLKITDEGLKYGAFRMTSGKDYLVLLGHDKDFTPPDTQRWEERTGGLWVNPMSGWQRKYSRAAGIWDLDERGSLNAVYEFLRGLGVRWYMPGELGEIVPEQKTIALAPVDKVVRPDFAYRDLGNYSPHFDNGTRDAILYRLRIGLDPSPAFLGINAWPHGLNNVHAREAVKQAHPEYYALYGGQRAINHMRDGAPCLSSPELFAATVAYARAFFDTFPDEATIGIMPADGYTSLCQCDLCKGKDTPERGWDGVMSDYVWDFVNRVAIELYKTHPDKKVINSAYGSYRLPPEKIAKFSPNVMVVGPMARDLATRGKALELRQGYLDKLSPGNMITGGHYLHSRPGRPEEGIPVYFPHLIAEDLHSLKGLSGGEFIELSQGSGAGGGDMHAPGFNHLNVYVTARYYWDADQDVDAMLDEYYRLFYGPAAGEMKAFIEFSETNWPLMRAKVEPIEKAFELLDNARKAAGDTIYGKRVALVIEYVQPMQTLRDKLAAGRKGVPQAVAVERKRIDLKLDGRLDKPFWENAPVYELKELVTGNPPVSRTWFKVAWIDDRSILLGVHCEDADMKGLNIGTKENENANMWNGDVVEILLETQTHSYYQIAINAAGALIDLDRKEGIDSRWSSEAEVATHIGDTFWSVEARIPTADWLEGGFDPMKKLNGKKPEGTAPWYFEVCRVRRRGDKDGADLECSAFSPVGTMSFHVPMKFGELIVK